MTINISKTPSTCNYSMNKETSELYWNLMKVKRGNVLDIASGMGGFGLSKPPMVNLFGIERDEAISTNSFNYKQVFNCDLNSLKSIPFDKIAFDGVLARDILEHLDRPWELLDLIYNRMSPGSSLVCSVPKPDPSIVWNDYTHIRGFTKHALNSLIQNSGFVVDEIFPMSGYTIATKLGITRYLPLIGRLPVVNLYMVSYHAIAHKPK